MTSFVAAVLPEKVLWLSAILFSIGLVGVTCRRNILVMLLSIEIMLNAANLTLVAFSRVHGDVAGQVMVFFAMTVAAVEVAVGLAIVIALYRIRQQVDADAASDLRETDLGGMPPITVEGKVAAHAADHHDEPAGHGGADAHDADEPAVHAAGTH